jgi:hypothetical protein
MKKKEVNKKLSLNKKTISNLNEIEMNGIYGGSFIPTLCIILCLTPTTANTVPQTKCDCTTTTDTESQGVTCG